MRHGELRSYRGSRVVLLEAVLKRTRTTKHPWLIACDANMSPEDYEKSLWFRKDQMHVIAPEGVSTCRSKNAKGEWVEKVYDYVIACNSLKGKISQMQVVEDLKSRPHKAVTFVVERRKERQEWNEQKLPKALPGYSGGKLPGWSTKEKGRDEGEEDRGSEERRIRDQIIKEVIASIQKKASDEDVENKEKKTGGQSLMRSCSAVGGREKIEEIMERRRMEGSSLQVDALQKVPELVVHERTSQGKRVKGLKDKKIPG